MPYADRTSVPVERSRTELQRLLTKHGADAFGYATEGRLHQVQFRIEGRSVRLRIQAPDPSLGETKVAQEERRRWRALLLIIKAKLVACEAGVTSLEREFLADVMLPTGQTVGETLAPQIAAALEGHEILLIEAPRP